MTDRSISITSGLEKPKNGRQKLRAMKMSINEINALEHPTRKLIGWHMEVRFFTPFAYEHVYKAILVGLHV